MTNTTQLLMGARLKPCPFCEGEAGIVRGDSVNGHPRWYKIYCKRCQNRTWEHPRKANALAAWNTRPRAASAAGHDESRLHKRNEGKV